MMIDKNQGKICLAIESKFLDENTEHVDYTTSQTIRRTLNSLESMAPVGN